jgi:drug/metabolite transporter (DMT)-like permease
VGALIFNAAMALPLYQSFPAVIGCAFVGSVVGTYLTAPVKEQVLIDFWVRINPWGLWGRIGKRALESGTISKEKRLERTIENLNDWVALCFAIPFQLCLLLGGMSFIFHDWKKFAFFAIAGVFSSIGLYFFWYQNLKSDADCKKEDAMYAAKKRDSDGEGNAEDDEQTTAEAGS